MSLHNTEQPSYVIEDLIVAWHDCQRLRGELDAAQLRYGHLVDRLKPLALASGSRIIFHDGYVCGVGYVPTVLTIYPHGAVHMASVEKGNQLRWPEPEAAERPQLHHVANGGSIQAPLQSEDDTPPPPDANTIWNRFWDGDDTFVLASEVVRAALAPDDLLDSHLDG